MVNLRGGQYELNKPLYFDSNDGGNSEYSVTYKAYKDEKPVISGGVELKGFESIGGGLWQTKIGAVKEGRLWFRSLFVDGKRLTRSRWPDSECVSVKDVSNNFKHLVFNEKLPTGVKQNDEAEILQGIS